MLWAKSDNLRVLTETLRCAEGSGRLLAESNLWHQQPLWLPTPLRALRPALAARRSAQLGDVNAGTMLLRVGAWGLAFLEVKIDKKYRRGQEGLSSSRRKNG